MNYKEIEYAGFSSWPSLEEEEFNGIVLRSSNGFTKRANSANVLEFIGDDYSVLVGRCEEYFKNKNLPCIFRIPSYCRNNDFDSYLEGKGYMAIDRSLILIRNLEGESFQGISFQERSCEDWLKSYCRIVESSFIGQKNHLDILERITDKLLMAVLEEDGKEIACGIGVISNGYFGVFDVVTGQEFRKKGYAKKLLNAMLNWAVSNGAVKSYIQVIEKNQDAVNLYGKLGYSNCYKYWYRIKHVNE